MAGFGINPNFNWQQFGGEALQDIGYGLGQAPTIWGGLAAGSRRSQDMQPARDEASRMKAAEDERKKAIVDQAALRDKYSKQFIAWGKPDIAQGIADGLIDPAQAYWDHIAPKTIDPVKGIEINGQLVNPETGEPMGDFRSPETPKQEPPPSGYRYGDDGNLKFIPGGPADPSTNAKTTEATRRNQQLAKVMIPEAESLLGKGGQGGTFDSLANGGNQFADSINVFGAKPAYGMTGADFQQAKNSIKTVVASYLYSVSGATATDDEVSRQTDVLTPKPFEAPESVAQKKARLQQMVEAVVEAANGTPMQGAGAPNGGVVDYTEYFK